MSPRSKKPETLAAYVKRANKSLERALRTAEASDNGMGSVKRDILEALHELRNGLTVESLGEPHGGDPGRGS